MSYFPLHCISSDVSASGLSSLQTIPCKFSQNSIHHVKMKCHFLYEEASLQGGLLSLTGSLIIFYTHLNRCSNVSGALEPQELPPSPDCRTKSSFPSPKVSSSPLVLPFARPASSLRLPFPLAICQKTLFFCSCV